MAGNPPEESLMKTVPVLIAAALAALTVSSGAMAQSYADDMACRQYADSQTAAMRNQAQGHGLGRALVGAGVGAAIGGAVGGGRGAGIGAASGAAVGILGCGRRARRQEAAAQQQYNALYAQCMAARSAPPPSYAPAYPAPPASTTSQLNQQELNRVQGMPR